MSVNNYSPLQPSYDPTGIQQIHRTSVENKEKAASSQAEPTQPLSNKEASNKACASIIKNESSNFKTLSDKLMGFLSQDPAIGKKISDFKANYQEPIKALDGQNWMALKSELKEKMQTEKNFTVNRGPDEENISYEEFRQAARKFQIEVANLAAEKLGICQCKGIVFGTGGFDSDIDLVISPQEDNVSQHNLMLYKTIVDSTWTHTMGGLSGVQADLEVYLESPGLTLNTESKVYSTPIGKAGLSRVELTMSMLELRRSFGPNESGWSSEKAKILKSLNSSDQEGMKLVFKSVEDFDKNLAKEILKQASREGDTSPEGLKKAAATYKNNRLLTLSEKLDTILQTIVRLSAKPLENADKIAKLEVQAAAMEGVRYAMFDEAYLTQSAYIKTCEAKGGQKDKLKLPQKSGEERVPATKFQYVLAMLEDGAKYNAKIEKKMAQGTELSKLQHAAIDSSKYANRISSSALAFLEMVSKMSEKELDAKGISKSFVEALKEKADNLNTQTIEMEKSKRKVILNEATFLKNMSQLPGKGSFIEKQMKEISKIFDDHAHLEPIKKYDLAMHKISAISPSLMSNAMVQTNLKARAGFDRMLTENSSLNKVHEDSEHTTLEHFKMGTAAGIHQFNASIKQLSDEVLKLSLKLGVVVAPAVVKTGTAEFEMFDLTTIWQNADLSPLLKEQLAVSANPAVSATVTQTQAEKPKATLKASKPVDNDSLVKAALKTASYQQHVLGNAAVFHS